MENMATTPQPTSLAPSRRRTNPSRINPLYGAIAATLIAAPDQWHSFPLSCIPGKHKGHKSANLLNALADRGLLVTTRTLMDETIYVRMAGGAR